MAGSLHIPTFILAIAVLIYISDALRIAPRKSCPNGITGLCIKGKCPLGGYCKRFGPGPAVCCRATPVCRYGSKGKCVAKKGPKCAPGYSCTIPKGSKVGDCCRKKPIKPALSLCKYGITGICGLGRKCKPGSTCKRFKGPGRLQKIGRCCRDKRPIKPLPMCKYGSNGICGPKGPKCKPGSTCKYFLGPKGPGRCCLNKLPG